MEETAYHESGHAFMAVFLGGQVRSLTIEPDRDDGPERFGDVQIVWRRHGMSVKEFQNKQVLVALAGPIAETIYRGEPLHPGFVPEWADDWRRAWEAAELILPDEQLRLAFLEETARQLHSTNHLRSALQHSDGIVGHPQKILRLGGELAERGGARSIGDWKHGYFRWAAISGRGRIGRLA